MNMTLLAWGMSFVGALLFFSAGAFYALRRLSRVSDGAPLEPMSEPSPLRVEPPPVVMERSARSDVFHAILQAETRDAHLAGAVIADDAGLVVACTGEHGEALAAYGALLAGVGTKTRDGLPLRELRQVIVQDDQDMILTVRPIAAADDTFALVTLARGPYDTAQRSTAVFPEG